MLRFYAIACIFFTATFLSAITAQSTVSGTLSLRNGKTISGQIGYTNWTKNPSSVRITAETGTQTYPAADIETVAVQLPNGVNETYRSFPIEYDAAPFQTVNLDRHPNPQWQRDTVLLRLMYKGLHQLFYLNDAKDKRHFFLQSGTEPPKELVYKRFYEGNSEVVKTNYRFRQQLIAAFYDCPEVYTLVKSAAYNQRTLIDLFKRYDACKNHVGEALPTKRTGKAVWGIVTGFSASKPHLPANLPAGFQMQSQFYNINAGPSFEFFLGRTNHRVSYYSDLVWNRVRYDGAYKYSNFILGDDFALDYQVSLLRWSNLAKIGSPAHRKNRYWFGAGMSVSIPVTEFVRGRTTTKRVTSTEVLSITREEERARDMPQELGIIAAVGFQHKRLGLALRFDYLGGLLLLGNDYIYPLRDYTATVMASYRLTKI